MTRIACCLLVGLFAAVPAVGEDRKAGAPKYMLRYQFHPGETLRWEVAHRVKVRTTVSGTTQTAETVSTSVKVWKVKDVKPDSSATFHHQVERVDMRQKLSGQAEVRYNSQADKSAPPGFEDVAKSVGAVLSIVTMDAKGKILKRERKQVAAAAAHSEGQMTIPLPEVPVAVGHTWSFPQEIDVPLDTGGIKKVKARQTFTLKSVKTGVATICVATQILTPIDDPALESQLIQRESSGTVRFDIDAGRIISQQMDVDKHVVGFRGAASSLHYVTCFTEKLLR